MPQIAKSNRIKILTGATRPDRQVPEVLGHATPPECPNWLPEAAQGHFKRVVSRLLDLGVGIDPLDQNALATYANLCGRQEECPEAITASEIAQMRTFWKEFGLTPAARDLLGIDTKPKKPNKFDMY